MKDLNKANFSRKNSFGNKLKLAAIVVVVVVVLVIILRAVGIGGGGGGITLRDAQTNLKPVTISSSAAVTSGVNLKTEKATLKDVKFSGQASATATRAYGGGVYTLTVQATLPDPKNTYYQVWVVGSGKPVPVDFMNGSKTTWSLSIKDADKFSKYSGILITLERTKDDIPEEHVMEGSF